jgi:hypothetical protein
MKEKLKTLAIWQQYRGLWLAAFPALLLFTILSIAINHRCSPVAPMTEPEDTTRTIQFAGRTWYVKEGIGLGPGNNNWSDDPQSVWVDDEGKLHLRIRKIDGRWYSAQVNAVDYTGYGLHRFFVETPLDNFDEDVVVGLFLYRDDDHELDIEISRQGQPPGANAKYAVQPYFHEGNRESFTLEWDGPTTHEIEWFPGVVRFASIRESGHVIHQWSYRGDDIPDERHRLRIQINLWLAADTPAREREVELVISDLEVPFSPYCR